MEASIGQARTRDVTNDIATLLTNDERTRYFYILKIFLFSLKGDGKIWFNSVDPGCVRSPHRYDLLLLC